MRRPRRIRHARHTGAHSIEARLFSDEQHPQSFSKETELVEQIQTLEGELQSIRQDLYEAVQVQRGLNGPRELRRANYEIACETFPVRNISGDFCTVFDVGHRTVFALGDIAGKGLTAGMWFTHVVSLVRVHGASAESAARSMALINEDLCKLRPEPPLITVFLGSFDWHSNSLTYSKAGHPPPILARRDGKAELLHSGGPVLGVVPNAHFDLGTVELESGDGLLAYSDGISELQNEQGEEFGYARLLSEIAQCDRSSAAHMLFCMLGVVKDFAGSTQPCDDLSMLAVLHRGTAN